MTKLPTQLAVALALALLLAPGAANARAQSPDAVADLAARINHERVTRGLAPFALNPQLTAAAQAHADDIARTAHYDHTGSDGSTARDRVARAGYGKYSWGYRVGENWAHYRSVPTAMAMWMDSPPHRNNILHALYREMGIGVAADKTGLFIYVINFGAQPNVLPIFINDDAAETRMTNVTITLTDEQVMPNGDGVNSIGHPTHIQIANTADFANAEWQPYAARRAWTLTPGAGTRTVYVKYRDAKGRTATASDSILLVTSTPPATTPRPTATRTRTPSATAPPTASPTATPTWLPTDTPVLTLTATATSVATHTPTPSAPATAVPAFNPIALCGLGVGVMLAVIATVTFLTER